MQNEQTDAVLEALAEAPPGPRVADGYKTVRPGHVPEPLRAHARGRVIELGGMIHGSHVAGRETVAAGRDGGGFHDQDELWLVPEAALTH